VVFYQRSGTEAAADVLVPEFNRTHPGLKVKLVITGANDDTSTLASAIRAGNPPDLVGLNDIDITEFDSKNTLMDLTKYIKALPEYSSLSKGHLALGEYEGAQYAVPYLADVSVLWYNKVLFNKADITGPPKTIAEMVTDANKIQALKLAGTYGISFAGDCQGCMAFAGLPDMWANHDYLIEGKIPNQRIDIEGNKDLTAWLNAYHEMWKNGDAPVSDQTDTGTTWGKDFASGNVGIFPAGYDEYTDLASSKNLKNYGVAGLPGVNGDTATFDGGDDFVIPTGAKNASGAWEFVRWMLQEKQQTALAKYGLTPVVGSVLDAQFEKQYPYDTVAVKVMNHDGYAPTTMIYDTAINEPDSPWFKLFSSAVFSGQTQSAEKTAQSAFSQLLVSTSSGK
jgi:multiple sugar transport system substrate-binding protein